MGGTVRKIAIPGLVALGAQMLPFAAHAADMSVYQKAAVPPSSPGWSGLYAGGNVGDIGGSGSVSDSLFGLSASSIHNELIGGGQAGFNLQYGFFVFGMEGDIDLANSNSTGPAVATRIGTIQERTNLDSVATLAARFGVAYGPLLFYGKVGGGWVESSATITHITAVLSNTSLISASNTSSGGMGGVGVEWAFYPNWSAKFEYDWLHVPSWTLAGSSVFPNDTFTVSRNIQMVKAGFNYKFNWFGWGYASY